MVTHHGASHFREADQGEKGDAQLPRMQTEKGQMHIRFAVGCGLYYVQ
jgi:hypothetical protein